MLYNTSFSSPRKADNPGHLFVLTGTIIINANFFTKLVIKSITSIQSIKKAFVTKGKYVQFEWFFIPLVWDYQSGRISLFRRIVSIYFGTINHQPRQFMTLWLSVGHCRYNSCTFDFSTVGKPFESKAERQISVPVFQIVQKLSLSWSFDKTTW